MVTRETLHPWHVLAWSEENETFNRLQGSGSMLTAKGTSGRLCEATCSKEIKETSLQWRETVMANETLEHWHVTGLCLNLQDLNTWMVNFWWTSLTVQPVNSIISFLTDGKRNIQALKNSVKSGRKKREAGEGEALERVFQNGPLDYEELLQSLNDDFPYLMQNQEEKRFLGECCALIECWALL